MKIDLSKLPEGTRWIAIDEDGVVSAFSGEPTRNACAFSGYFEYTYDWRSDYTIGNVHD